MHAQVGLPHAVGHGLKIVRDVRTPEGEPPAFHVGYGKVVPGLDLHSISRLDKVAWHHGGTRTGESGRAGDRPLLGKVSGARLTVSQVAAIQVGAGLQCRLVGLDLFERRGGGFVVFDGEASALVAKEERSR